MFFVLKISLLFSIIKPKTELIFGDLDMEVHHASYILKGTVPVLGNVLKVKFFFEF